MLIYNMRRVFALRGIDKPHKFLVDNGFAASTASAMLTYYPIVFKVKSLEKLCVALSCTPSDLFEWRDDGKIVLQETHPINSLRREKITKKLSDIIKDLPLDKLDGLESYLENYAKEESRPES